MYATRFPLLPVFDYRGRFGDAVGDYDGQVPLDLQEIIQKICYEGEVKMYQYKVTLEDLIRDGAEGLVDSIQKIINGDMSGVKELQQTVDGYILAAADDLQATVVE